MKIDLSIIVVSFNHEKYIGDCLKSVKNNSNNIRLEVIVVDNNSHDNSVKLVKQNSQWLRLNLIQNQVNLGFAKAVNQGIGRATGEYILILNPDTEIKNDSLSKMIRYLNLNQSRDCITPRLINPDGSLQKSVRNFPTLTTFLIRRTPLRVMRWKWLKAIDERHLAGISYHKIEPITWSLGCAIFARKTLFNKVGLFDENFFAYCEDIDWFYRLKKLGIKAYYFPIAKIIHHHLAISDKALFSRESYFHLRSMAYYFRKYWREILIN